MTASMTERGQMNQGPKFNGVGEVIKELREQASLSQKQLADELGWDKGRLSKYENNHLSLSLRVLDRISQALGQPNEKVILLCFRKMYPDLTLPESEIGRLLETLVKTIEKS